jgi:hypothetical protein
MSATAFATCASESSATSTRRAAWKTLRLLWVELSKVSSLVAVEDQVSMRLAFHRVGKSDDLLGRLSLLVWRLISKPLEFRNYNSHLRPVEDGVVVGIDETDHRHLRMRRALAQGTDRGVSAPRLDCTPVSRGSRWTTRPGSSPGT